MRKIPKPEDISEYSKEYSEEKYSNKVSSTFRKAGIETIFMTILLSKIMKANTTPVKKKLMIAGSLGYFIMPIDVFPDFIPIVGFLDDLAVLVSVSHTIFSEKGLLSSATIAIITESRSATLKLFPNRESDIDKIIKKHFPKYYE